MFDQYLVSNWGLLFILFTLLLQTMVATVAHRRQGQYVPGVVNEKLSHDSFVFRSHRTFQNSLENVPMLFGMAVLAMLTGLNPTWLAATVWVFAVARFIHMALYYVIATEKNPSPRSLFFVIGLLSNLVLLGMMVAHFIGQ
ncbi:MAG: MAPEG family protein [Halioglobus sp.]